MPGASFEELFDCPRCHGEGAVPGWACCGRANGCECCGDPDPVDFACPWCQGAKRLPCEALTRLALAEGDLQTLARLEAQAMLRQTLGAPSKRAARL